MAIPLMISSPDRKRWHQISFAMASHLDLMPTFLDWYGIKSEVNTNGVRDFTGELL
jgi:arylsulfatase A-like enzyme